MSTTSLVIELAFGFMLTVQFGTTAWIASVMIKHITDRGVHK